ncbi:MAG TPA: carbohydrate kinase family protein [Mycobacteriales bacterium]
MTVVLTGSIATDHLMQFRGRFADSILPESLHKLSVSFLVDDLVVRRGGVAANIAFGMAQLGRRPVLVGAVGDDFADYRAWLDRHGVDTASIHVSADAHTARFTCTTDEDMNQIASFYPGAMREARDIELGPVAARLGGIDLVVVSPNDPDAMLRHTDEARASGVPFVADPSQQLAFMGGEQLRALVDGAAYLVTNDYERDLLAAKTGWTQADIDRRVGVRLTTIGKDGVEIARTGEPTLTVPVVPEVQRTDPTGVGDAFRAGLLSALSVGLDLVPAARLGSLLATYTLETLGTQEYAVRRDDALARLADTYGRDAADELAPFLGG